MVPRAGRGLAAALIGLVPASALVGCSDGSSTPDSAPTTTAAPITEGQAPLRVEDIRPAIEALEAKLAGPQQYFEVNATPTLVNLFVATENATKAVAYVYAVGELREPAEPQPASGPTFTADQLDFDDQTVLANVVAQLPTSQFRGFSAVGVETGGVSYLVTVDSKQGGRLEIAVTGDGEVIGASPP